MSFTPVFHSIDSNPVWSRLSEANLLVCLVRRWSLTFRSIGGLSVSICGGFEFGVWRDPSEWVSLDHLIRRTCRYLRGVFVFVGLAVIDGCVVWTHNLQDSNITELHCGSNTFSQLFNQCGGRYFNPKAYDTLVYNSRVPMIVILSI